MLKVLLTLAFVAHLGYCDDDLDSFIQGRMIPAIERCSQHVTDIGKLIVAGYEQAIMAAMHVQKRDTTPIAAIIGVIREDLDAYKKQLDIIKGAPSWSEAQAHVSKLMGYTQKVLDDYDLEEAFIDSHQLILAVETVQLMYEREVFTLSKQFSKALAHDTLGTFVRPLQSQNWANTTANLAPMDVYGYEIFHSIFHELHDEIHDLFFPFFEIITYFEQKTVVGIHHPIKKRHLSHQDLLDIHGEWGHLLEDWDMPENLTALGALIDEQLESVCKFDATPQAVQTLVTRPIYHAALGAVIEHEDYLIGLLGQADFQSDEVKAQVEAIATFGSEYGSRAYAFFMGYVSQADRDKMGLMWADTVRNAVQIINDSPDEAESLMMEVFQLGINNNDERYKEMMQVLSAEAQLAVGYEVIRAFLAPLVAIIQQGSA